MEHRPLHKVDPQSNPMATAPQNRRRPSRFPFLRFVTLGLGTPDGFDGQTQKCHAAAINVSEGGLCLLVNQPLQESDIIRVDLPLADVSTTSATLAEVKWCKPLPWCHSESQHYFVGVQFLL